MLCHFGCWGKQCMKIEGSTIQDGRLTGVAMEVGQNYWQHWKSYFLRWCFSWNISELVVRLFTLSSSPITCIIIASSNTSIFFLLLAIFFVPVLWDYFFALVRFPEQKLVKDCSNSAPHRKDLEKNVAGWRWCGWKLENLGFGFEKGWTEHM